METREYTTDVLIIGGGTAGTMAAIKAKQANPELQVLVLDKADIRRSGAISMGMDGLNNAVIPGKATPEEYTLEITESNDGIIDQRAVYRQASECFGIVQELDSWGVDFEKDETGYYNVHRVHRKGRYVLPMPKASDLKVILAKKVKQMRCRVVNRVMATRLLTKGNQVIGALGLDVRTGDFVIVRAKAVVMTAGAAGRMGLTDSGYLYSTYENPTNSGEGFAMAYHAGAELTGIECYQINPTMKDYNGPACAYVAGPFGGYTANSKGERVTGCDYWSGELIMNMWKLKNKGEWPLYLKLTHLEDNVISEIESILHNNERPSRDRFHEGRGKNYRTDMVELNFSEVGLCSGHSASGVLVNHEAETSMAGLYAAGDMACVPHQYLLGALTFGKIAGTNAAAFAAGQPEYEPDPAQIEAERERLLQPLSRPDGVPHQQVEYKIRRIVTDYLLPPKTLTKLDIALEKIEHFRKVDLQLLGARDPHELGRAMEIHSIVDCAEMMAKASMFRKESRWGFYHYFLDYPERDDANWLKRVIVRKGDSGAMELYTKELPPYILTDADRETALEDRQGEVNTHEHVG
ncbi:fumarate reductase/succinate dehydrogenase flavoprotein subunit [Paenibacillus mucilaginosus]|uniref:FAD binding domain-containing protein n=3 Tax=Paenibacillus mucilaginosus TaxID=61624 RepID=H6NJT9_9BACL|nr:fumarate reductase/succinate dehydrogenase flavoprotein subunit [Paenibacillus mucilaginosus]AEI41736.1 FAD binding domain protein [Paenibacillus mucilaginosus KNP414]AFC30243.1 FAD binding domain-containing protein [Paenibacillus mucilaginosus 3016]AFH62516.1 oxidoreductase [Paenibacillus mucilaginosus K02]MCG7214426.1 fumarate reductase/succinate dehydrogenase flavoprotein subunit [Paenibacillus mucilaginosus]WDM30710.1 fumarate reductase/succinate dehydrogenase flavoprotein subunit [Paen